jgi:tetratricopeptide (TPR) repeat protein
MADRRPWILSAVLVLAGALVYANSLSGVFTFDDEVSVVGNSSIRSLSDSLTPPERGEPVAGRPLVNLTFAINYAAGGLDVRGYHIVNVALHIACALLLFGLVRRALTGHLPPSTGQHVAFAAALIWVVHPLNTEAVNYVSQRTELMMAFFYLLTLYANARTAKREGGRGKGEGGKRKGEAGTSYGVSGLSRTWVAIAFAACAAGMACKEVMVTAPVLVILYDRTFVYGSFKDALAARWKFYLALASTWLLLAFLIRSAPRWESAGFSTGISVWTYLLNQTVMIVTYLRTALWPVGLVFDYGEPQMLTPADVAPYGVIILLLLALTVFALKKYPSLGFPAAAFFIILAPTSSIVPIATEVGADRRMYLPLTAVVVLVVVAVRAGLKAGPYTVAVKRARKNSPVGADPSTPLRAGLRVGPYMAAAVVVALAFATVQRNKDYQTELSLWQTTLDRMPNARAHRNYATVLKRAGRGGDEVVEHLREGVRLGHPEGRYALGYELYEQGRRDEAITELRQFIRQNPADSQLRAAHVLIGRALADQGRHEEGISAFEAALRIDPGYLDAHAGLADALLDAGQFDAAIVHYQAVIKQRPRFARAWSNLGVALVRAGREDGVREAFTRAVELDPQNGAAQRALAAVLFNAGDIPGAIEHAEAAVRLLPGDPAAHELLDLARSLPPPR